MTTVLNPTDPSSLLPTVDLAPWLDLIQTHRTWLVWITVALVGLWVLQRIGQGLMRWQRRRRPATINPKLQKYNIDHAEENRHLRQQAAAIIATSTGNRLAGFRIIRQVEAVFVDGYRSPEDALIALKADAGKRGANALLNVKTERTSAGRCSASGDAVLVAPMILKGDRQIAPPPPPPKTD